MMTVPSTRNALAEYLRDQASWRRLVADEHDDDRSRTWAGELDHLADWLQLQPSDRPELRDLDALWGRYGLDVFAVPGERSRQLTNRPDFTPGEEDAWLAALLEAFRTETVEEAENDEELIALTEDPDPRVALHAIRRLRYLLDEHEEDAVLRATVEGMSWAQIGSLLGRSKQAVWEKHHDPDDRSVDS